ncbi:MAG: hypothetical protein GY771_12110, partial [bacterium]|nr:hypothetical protein [bacterium]
YVVNTSWLGKAEYLPEYIAIMGRFMLLHYDHAIGDGSRDGLADPILWNSFRMSLQNYLIEANTDSDSEASYIPGDDRLLRFLKDLEDRTDAASVTKLAVTLLVSFDPTWTLDTIPKVLSDINQEERLVAEEHLAASVKSIWGN